jgi:prepilin-type N-terminal cleavage/methylation domain-containing protein
MRRTLARRGRVPAAGRGGFTLFELLVVVVLTAMLAAAASLTLLHAVRRATADDVLRRLAELDGLIRRASRRAGRPMQLVLGPGSSGDERGVAGRQRDDDGQDTGVSVRLPAGTRMERVWLADGRDPRTADWGEVVVHCSRLGRTPTYGFELVGPDGRHYWRVVPGLTGTLTEATDEEDLLRAFGAMAGDAARAHAR